MYAGMRRAMALVTVVCLGVLVTTASAAPEPSSATRLIDRTLTCRVGFFHGARLIYLTVHSAVRHGDAFDSLAQAYVTTPGSNPLSTQNARPTLAGVTAGWPPPPPFTTDGLGYENSRCGPSRAKVPLAPRGLTGGAANAFGDDVQCIVGKTLLVRVRATFRDPVEEEPNKAGTYVQALGHVVAGQVAVATLSGKPIAYADVAEGGRARMFTKAGCL
jgi:hypothetical protein